MRDWHSLKSRRTVQLARVALHRTAHRATRRRSPNTHLRALLRCLWQAPVAAVPHHLLCGQLYQQQPEGVQVSREGASCTHQLLWGCIQAAAAFGGARCSAQNLRKAQVS